MQSVFPFKLEDLKAWTIKRTDGTVTKFVLSTAALQSSVVDTKQIAQSTQGETIYRGVRAWCGHTPTSVPLVTFHREEGDLSLWVANMGGARTTKDAFNFVIDCGDVLDKYSRKVPILLGDEELAQALEQYTECAAETRVLKIDWDDRQAPPVSPQFWAELNKLINGDVMTCCIGGHGRSGTAFVCLLLANALDYDASDAIVHTRAVHCLRAIESTVQHSYIDEVANYFGREGNSEKASKIADYKGAFRASTKSTAVRTKDELKWN